MPTPRILIYVEDGICETVHSDHPDIHVVRVDRDSDNPEEHDIATRLDVEPLTRDDQRVFVTFADGERRMVYDIDGRIVERG